MEEEAITTTTTPLATPPTLREFLSHPDGFHMAFAPAFFGFFAYFGALAALEEETGGVGLIVPSSRKSQLQEEEKDTTPTTANTTCNLKSVAGASAGAMAAVMLAAGIQPRDAAKFASTFTWSQISDPPGWGGYAKGNNFEECMRRFIMEAARIVRREGSSSSRSSGGGEEEDEEGPSSSSSSVGKDDSGTSTPTPFRLEEALVPVAVSVFDIVRMKEKILSKGCMAKAARASAGFPGLFQPVAWRREEEEENSDDNTTNDTKKKWGRSMSMKDYSLLIDGGITDNLGLNGLGAFSSSSCTTEKKRVINMVVGDFQFQNPSSSSSSTINNMPKGVTASSLVSIALVNTPVCGPWAMKNGPRAVESTRRAMAAMLDVPMERVLVEGTSPSKFDDDNDNHYQQQQQHYVLRVDASKWLE